MILNPIGDPQVTHNHSGEIRAFWVIAPFRKLPWVMLVPFHSHKISLNVYVLAT